MFTFEEIKNISQDEFKKLSPENKELVLKILTEYKESGSSQTLKELWEVDYDEIPVSIEEFITNERYLGKTTGKGELIYPYWREKYKEIFDQHLNYEEIVLTGAIGVGKTRTAVICLCYLLYKLMCLKNPQAYFNLLEGDKITIFFLNITLTLAEGVGYKTMHEYLLASPWFMERGTVTGRVNERYNPPHNIEIRFGSKGEHALGQQVYAAFMDEIEFKKAGIKGTSAFDMSNAVMDAYSIIKSRIKSRFIKNGVLYGRLFLVSSKKSEHDFLEQYVQKMKNDRMLVVDEPQWVIKPKGTFDPRTFAVAVGNRSLRSRVLGEEVSEEERKALIQQGYRILDVPLNFRDEFKLDINRALMDLAGIALVGTTSFFNYDMFSECYIQDYKNPFVTEVITLGIHDDMKIQDFFELDKVPASVKYMPQFIHIDGSLTGDRTGISSVGVSGLKETQQYNGAYEFTSSEMTYKHIFSVGIKAPQGSEISFEKTRQFIYWLKQSGFNIIGVSLDGFQSADSKQIFISNNYDASIISMDKTPQAYLTLRSAMNDKRIGLIKLDLLETELVQLQRDVQTGKIDHPRDGCFTADTKVALVDGRNLTISELMLEQQYKKNYVYTVNETTHVIEPKPIKKVFQTKITKDLVRVTLDNGSSIECTPEHRFMLRDGSYKEAQYLDIDDRLMPLYTDICEKGLVGYRLYYDPFSMTWKFEHRQFCNNIRSEKGVVHHRNYNKQDNRPCNLIKISRSEHQRIHNNNTKDYNKLSHKIKQWHEENRGTQKYIQRSEKCRQSVYRCQLIKNKNYVPKKELNLKRIQEIEKLFDVCWENLTTSEKDSYSVKYNRYKHPEVKQVIINSVKQKHKEGKYKNAYKALHGRVWYTNGQTNMYIKEAEPVPEGFYRGRTIDYKMNHKKLSERTPEEQARLKKCYASASGKVWITNDVEEHYICKDDILPDGYRYGRKKREYKNHKVVSVERILKPCRVYDLEIEDNHNFALACGVFVHNSKDIADSLAGALFNATLHKQSLMDNMQLLSVAADVNEEYDPRQEILDNMSQSLLAQNKNSYTAAAKLEELLNGYGNDSNILAW